MRDQFCCESEQSLSQLVAAVGSTAHQSAAGPTRRVQQEERSRERGERPTRAASVRQQTRVADSATAAEQERGNARTTERARVAERATWLPRRAKAARPKPTVPRRRELPRERGSSAAEGLRKSARGSLSRTPVTAREGEGR